MKIAHLTDDNVLKGMNDMKKNHGNLTGILALVLALSLALGLGSIALAAGGDLTGDEITAIVDTKTDKSLITSPFIEVAKKTQGSVVGVNNYQTVRRSQFGYNYGFPFDQLPGAQDEEQRSGTGSGTVISAYGHVLTNYHVIENATRVTVTVGEKELDAAIVGSDSDLDIAVLLVPGLDLPAVPLGDSDDIQVGEYAIVIGNPLGQQFERSVTVGVVSAVERKMSSTNRDRYGLLTANENRMIQVDSAISSGNSGGGMFNTLGQLQGIPTLKLVDNSGNFFSMSGYSVDNIGMCVPINAAKPLIRSVLESYNSKDVSVQAEATQEPADQPARPRIGVSVGTLSSNYLPVAQGILPQGAYIANVEKNSPAETSGLKIGDIIVEADSQTISNQSQLIAFLQQMKEGDTVKLKVYRVPGLPEALENSELLDQLGKGEYLDFEVQLLILDPSHM
jgi:serine protease Do